MKSEKAMLADAGLVGRAAYAFLHPVVFLLAKLLFRMRVIGADRLPDDGSYVLAPVHRSGIDFLIASLVTRRRVRWMAKSNLWKYPFLGWFVQSLGAFKVNRGHADRAALRTGGAALRAGQPLIVFPEGTRKSGDEVVDLFDGAAWLACHQRVPLVPVGIAGTEEVMPRGAKFPRPAKIVLVIGEPIWPDIAMTGRVDRNQVKSATARLQESLQDQYDAAQAALDGRPLAQLKRKAKSIVA